MSAQSLNIYIYLVNHLAHERIGKFSEALHSTTKLSIVDGGDFLTYTLY